MKYSEKETEAKITRLEKQLGNLYKVAYREISGTISDYMATWEKREAKIQEQLDSSKLQPPAGETAESYMRKWRMNHVGMGQRWAKVRENIADRITNANVRAAEMIRGTVNGVYSLNRNYQAYQIEQYIPKTDIGNGKSIGVAFDLVNENAVRRLESGKRKLLPDPRVDIEKDQAWNMRKVQAELLSGIMQGKSVDRLAKGFMRVTDMNKAQAIRNARTACGAAVCAGQQANIEDAVNMGIQCMKEWMATLDDRTRDSHQELDGVRVDPDDVFLNGCMYPCDPNGDPKEVYNCRCTLKTVIPGLNDQRGKRIAKEGGKGKYVYLDDVTYKGRDDSKSYADWFQGKIDAAETDEKAKEYYEEGVNEGLDVNMREEEKEETAENNELKEPEFKDAESIEEATEFAMQFVNAKGFAASGVNYAGVSLEIANAVNSAVAKVYSNFNIGQIGGISAPAGNTKIGKMLQGATAAFQNISHNLFLNRSVMKNMKTAQESIPKNNRIVEDYFAHPEKYDLMKMSRTGRELILNSEKSGRAIVPETVEEAIYHEMGHMMQTYIRECDPDMQNRIWAEFAEKSADVSGYATMQKGEYVAESFCSYMKGENIIGDEIRAFFDSLRR